MLVRPAAMERTSYYSGTYVLLPWDVKDISRKCLNDALENT